MPAKQGIAQTMHPCALCLSCLSICSTMPALLQVVTTVQT